MESAEEKQAYEPSGPKIVVTLEDGRSFTIATDPETSPKTTKQITDLVGWKFYDEQRFHRAEEWVLQWGSPASKIEPMDSPSVGRGGSGQQLVFEDCDVEFVRGVVGIASMGPRLGGDSQLFVLKKDAPHLNEKYAVLGKVIEGMDVVDAIQVGDRIEKAVLCKDES